MTPPSEACPDPVAPGARPLAHGRAWLVRGLKLVVAAAILAYLFHVVPFGDVWAQMKQADPGWLAAAFAAALLMQVGIAHRLRRLIAAQGVELSAYQVFEINLSTLFYGLFLPGGNFTGIAIRFYRLASANQHLLNTGVALFFDRLLSTFCLLVVGIGFWFVAWPEDGGVALIAMTFAAVAFAGLTLAVFAPPSVPLLGTLQRLMQRFGGRSTDKLRHAIGAVWSLPRRTLGFAFVITLLTHGLGIAAYWCILRGMGLPVGWVTIAWVRSAIILATMIPLTPSGVGLREGATLLLLTPHGVAEDEALAFSLLIFGVTVLAVGLIGGLLETRRAFASR
ncbi:MAG: lysylphosphatidylglycerol synthase transmembrane domain-containing protein [Planctomycetota bacterium]